MRGNIMKKSSNNSKKSFGSGIKELVRKFLVALKRNPQYIPLASLIVSLLMFSLNLTDISNTTAKIQGTHMGLCMFVAMLLSMLSIICMLNAFPKRKKPNYPVIALLFVIFAVIIFVDVVYCGRINTAVNAPGSPINNEKDLLYIMAAYNTVITHIITISVTAVFTILEPVFAKLLKKINTSVQVDESENLNSIELSDEE